MGKSNRISHFGFLSSSIYRDNPPYIIKTDQNNQVFDFKVGGKNYFLNTLVIRTYATSVKIKFNTDESIAYIEPDSIATYDYFPIGSITVLDEGSEFSFQAGVYKVL